MRDSVDGMDHSDILLDYNGNMFFKKGGRIDIVNKFD